MNSKSVDLTKDGCVFVKRTVSDSKGVRLVQGWLTKSGQGLDEGRVFSGDELYVFCRQEELNGIPQYLEKDAFIVGSSDYFTDEDSDEDCHGPFGKIINVWYGTNENAEFSNLAKRPFSLKGRTYVSVEHAYQTWKSGKFDEVAYLSITGPGQKGRAVFKADRARNARIMKTLMLASFRQNSEAADALIATGNAMFTHEPEKGYWAVWFPDLLMEVRDELELERSKAAKKEG